MKKNDRKHNKKFIVKGYKKKRSHRSRQSSDIQKTNDKKHKNKNNINKSPGGDDAVNEHITTTTETFVCRVINFDF